MRYLLDTNHCSFIQRGQPQVVKHLMSLQSDDEINLSVISQGEILAGMQQVAGKRRRAELKALYEGLLSTTADVVPITSDVAHRYAEILVQLAAKGKPIPANDIWIAATAISHDMVVVTADGHFRYIDGLKVEDWSQSENSDARD